MTADPRAEAEKIIRDALERWVDTSASYYAAGFYSTDADNATDAILDALEADGWSLLPPGGQSRVEESWSHPDGTDCTEESCGPGPYRIRVTRTVTEWPNGNELITPWQPAVTPGEPA